MNKTQKIKDRFFKSIGNLKFNAIKAMDDENMAGGDVSNKIMDAELKNLVKEDNSAHESHADNKNSSSINKETRTGTRIGTIG